MSLYGYDRAKGGLDLSADVVVVGTGPGGAAIGRTLAEGGLRVVFVEEGPPTSRFRPNQPHTNRYHMQEDGMMVASGSGLMPVAAGRGVGGGSLVNSAIALRTPDYVLEGWIRALGGDERFAAKEMIPVFEELEAWLGVGVTPDRVAGENNRIIVRGARALGLHGGLIRRNAPYCTGCGVCNFGCPSGGKGSVDRNLIPMALARGAEVQADTRVDTILVEGDRVVGIEGTAMHTDTREPWGRVRIRADRVVISCGAIGTPRLFHQAGIADRLGPAVGKGLHVHPGSAVFGLCDHEVKMWKGATQGAFFEHPDLPGVLPHTFSSPPGVTLLAMEMFGERGKDAMALLPRLCGAVVMISDKGNGTVGATSKGKAKIRYWTAPEDVARIKAGMVETARVLLAGGARRVTAPVNRLGIFDDPEAMEAALADRSIEDFTMYASHPMATCRMGLDPETSVLAPTGETHGLGGLYVADASVFPTSLGVNPQLTTMAVATIIGRHMLR